VKRERGPAPTQVTAAIRNLVHAQRLSHEDVSYFDFKKREFTPHGGTDESVFSKEEIKLFDWLISNLDQFSAREVSDVSHTIVWKSGELGEILPYDSFFVSYLGDVTEEDMSQVQESIKQVENETGRAYA
jgi:hypothetical protein